MITIAENHSDWQETGADTVSLALERAVSRFGRMIRRVAWQYRLRGADLDELRQDVRIRLWRSLATAEKIAQAPASYVYRTAVSAAIDRLRRSRARREDLVEELPQREEDIAARDPDRELGDVELLRAIDEAVDGIPASRRPVVRMHLFGYHRQEIAGLMGWTDAKTRNLLYRGLGDLRERLIERGVTPEIIT